MVLSLKLKRSNAKVIDSISAVVIPNPDRITVTDSI
jgi:hypothetical protein